MRIDLHAHVLPREWPDLAARFGDPRWPRLEHLDPCSARIMVSGEVFREVTHQLYDVNRRLEDMNATGVDRQVLSTVPVMFSYWAKPKHTLELGQRLNDHIAELVRDHPHRFSGFGTVPLNDPELAVSELERCVTELGMVGVQIGSNIAGIELDDPQLQPFFTRAAELGTIVFIHPWQVLGAERMRSYYFTYTIAMPSETAFAVGAVIFGGVLDRLPNLQLVFAHGGGSAAYLIGRIERGWEVWEPAREHLHRSPTEALRCCHFDSVTWDAASLELLVRRVGADRVLLGSDYPFIMGEDKPGAIVGRAALSDVQRHAILGGNAEHLLGLTAVSGSSR